MIPPETATLFLKTQFLNNGAVAALIIRLEVAKMGTAVGDHLQETSARVEILRIFLEVLRQLLNAFTQKSHLHFR